MKKYFGILISLIGLIGTSVFATYEDFSNQLQTMGLDVKNVESQNSISRYDLARLLNVVECKDCIKPNQDMLNKYVQSFWSAFGSGKDFADISFGGGIYNNASYYYCIAYVGDNTYMRGYPKATSPVCGGQFCGTKNTTTAEFIQVVINIIAKYIYKDISLNRKEVNTRLTSLKTDSYEAKNFNSNEIKSITEKSRSCDNICALQNSNEVNLYLKYCMFNVTKCNMKEVGKIKQGYWPVAELNLLYSQNIIDINQSQRANTDKDIDGKTVLDTLFKLNGKVNCAFNNNYDCDGIDNTKDSCPNTYNPSQKDTDNDGIGDVCDDDIDNDTIKNPIGIVDEEGKIDISKRTKNIDNCLFVVNTGQEDIKKDSIGDACKNLGNQIGLYINMDKLEGSAPATTTFTAISKGNINDVVRDFGDGTQGNGTSITHTFRLPGMYNVQAIAKGGTINAKAQVIVIIGGQAGDDKALQTKANIIGGKNGTEITLSASLLGTFDDLEWIFQKENITSKKTDNKSFKKIFKQPGENPVLVKGYRNKKLAGISYFTIGIDQGKGAILNSNTANPEINQKVLFDTNTYNINQEDIVSVDRDFGDEIKKTNTTLTMEYTYTKPGKRVITQMMTLTNGEKMTNMITINVTDKGLLGSYALLMIPSSLIADIGEKTSFSTHIIGTLLKTPLIQIAEFGDGVTQKKAGTEKMPSMFVHSFQKEGMLIVQDSMYINQCTYLKNQATITINGTDICLDAKLQGRLNTAYKCDLDGDKIPDICDTDIDGDGTTNLLGLINFENKDCSYESDPSKPNANLNQEILTKQYQNICSLDNAPFKNNPDQLDLNQDGMGDIQDTTLVVGTGNGIDGDGDGIPDNKDLCPTIQETWNGINDEDGCPEIGLELGCTQQGIAGLVGITNDVIIVKPSDTTIPLASCGNGAIDQGESCNNCPQDIGVCNSVCGDGIQTAGETCKNCATDVPSCGICGNGKKEPDETCTTCPQDYGTCEGTGGGGTLSGGVLCGNGIIDPGETCTTCPQDVKLCIEIPNIGTCNQCPCQFSDFASDLTNNDQIRAILRDKKKTTPYKFSLPWIVDFQ